MAGSTFPHLLITLTIILSTSSIKVYTLRTAAGFLPTSSIEFRPVNEPFQVCQDCECCAADDPTNCSAMPCCFGIDCDLPDKPYGFCSFVPKTCNCTGCI